MVMTDCQISSVYEIWCVCERERKRSGKGKYDFIIKFNREICLRFVD